MSVAYTDVNPDPVASGIVQSFGRGGEFVHAQIAPLRTVPGKKFRHGKWTFADMQSAHHETKMPDKGPANVREHRGFTWDSDICVAHGLVEEWGDTDRKESAVQDHAIRQKRRRDHRHQRLLAGEDGDGRGLGTGRASGGNEPGSVRSSIPPTSARRG